jgi:hypothetical protein
MINNIAIRENRNAILAYNTNNGKIVETNEKLITLSSLWNEVVNEYFSIIGTDFESLDENNKILFKFLKDHKDNEKISNLFAEINKVNLARLFISLGCKVYYGSQYVPINILTNVEVLLIIKPNNYQINTLTGDHTLNCFGLFQVLIQKMLSNQSYYGIDQINAISAEYNASYLGSLVSTYYRKMFNKLFEGSGIAFTNSIEFQEMLTPDEHNL